MPDIIKQTPYFPETSSASMYHESTGGAIELFSLTDEEFEQRLPGFIQKRVTDLESSVTVSSIDDTSHSFDSYIHSETSLHPAEDVIGVLPFKVDDTSGYVLAVRASRTWYKHLIEQGMPSEKALLNAALRGSFAGQVEYFGSIYGHTMNRLHRLDEGNNPGSGVVSVAKIGDSAMCMERAAVVHNALMVMGVPSKYCIGKLSHSYDGRVKTEGHAYLEVIGTDGTRLIYDPTHPKIEKKGATEFAKPGIFPVGRDYDGRDVIRMYMTITDEGVPLTVERGVYTYTRDTSPNILGTLALQ